MPESYDERIVRACTEDRYSDFLKNSLGVNHYLLTEKFTPKQWLPVHFAASSGNMSAIKIIFEDSLSESTTFEKNDTCRQMLMAKDINNMTPLACAINTDELDAIKYLLEKAYPSDNTKEKTKIIKDMLKIHDISGRTPVQQAALLGREDILNYLMVGVWRNIGAPIPKKNAGYETYQRNNKRR